MAVPTSRTARFGDKLGNPMVTTQQSTVADT